MRGRITQPVKLTRPRIHNAVLRPRLFAQLDEARANLPGLVIVGPPGAGKSTLVASWLNARDIKGIWNQIDSGDADLATFFHFMSQAALPYTRKNQKPLPQFTPEYSQDVKGFSRRFFHELFTRLPADSVLVLDNCQEVSTDSPFYELICELLSYLPSDCLIVMVSREELPPTYAQAFANGLMFQIHWEQLRLSLDETRAIATRNIVLNEGTLQSLQASTGGWAAGVVLVLQHIQTGNLDSVALHASEEATFDYFATQVMAHMSIEIRKVLIYTAVLPEVPDHLAAELTGNPQSKAILERLHRKGLFIHRRLSSSATYSYHMLFRNFLLRQARSELSQKEFEDLQRRAANLLSAAGDIQSAIILLCQIGAWKEAEELILQEAPLLMTQGRWQTFNDRIALLPVDRRQGSAWLTYWIGMSQLPMNPTSAHTKLESAYDLFEKSGDYLGSLLSASAVAQAIYLEAAQFRKLGKWLPIIERHLGSPIEFLSPAAELQAMSGMLITIIFTQPGHSMARMCAERVLALMVVPIDANQRMTAAAATMLFALYTGEIELGRRLENLAKPVVEAPELTALNASVWYCYLGYLSVVDHTPDHGNQVFAKAEEIAGREGFEFILTMSYAGRSAIVRVGEAGNWLNRVKSFESGRPFDIAHHLGNLLYRAADRGDWISAVEHGARTMKYLDEMGSIFQRLIWEIPLSWALSELGRLDEAHQHLRVSKTLMNETGSWCYHALIVLAEANLARLEGRPEQYHQFLRQGFGLAADNFAMGRLAFWIPTAGAPQLCADALANNIETDFVNAYIREYPLSPPHNHPEVWPWRIRIRTLGQFEVIRDGQPITFSRKLPRKPINLLKAIIAFGESNIPLRKLCDALWPDEQGDAAQRSLEVALHRLRKILGHDHAVIVEDRMLSLNSDLVWTDVGALERIPTPEMGTGARGEEALREVRHMLGLYVGSFLPGDTDAIWTVSRRERVRARVARIVEVMGQNCEEVSDWEAALQWYRKGIEADDLAETFYQGSIRCLTQTGRRAEAMALFRRLRQTLSVTLGVPPSEKSNDLYQYLLAE